MDEEDIGNEPPIGFSIRRDDGKVSLRLYFVKISDLPNLKPSRGRGRLKWSIGLEVRQIERSLEGVEQIVSECRRNFRRLELSIQGEIGVFWLIHT